MASDKDSVLEFIRREKQFAVSHGIDPDHWERDYLAKPVPKREQIQSEWWKFLRAFNREFDRGGKK